MNIDELRRSLLFNDVLDVWMALCDEKGWNWYDLRTYEKFLQYLATEGVLVKELAVCAQEKGRKAALVRAISRMKGGPLRTQVVKLDEATTAKIRSFRL